MSKVKIVEMLLSSASLAVLSISTPAVAQTVNASGDQTSSDLQPSPNAPVVAPAGTAEGAGALQPAGEEILVTGSRITRNGYNTPTPVTVLTQSALTERTPTNLPDALNQLPQFQNSQSPAKRERATVNTRVNVGNFLNLRNLGAPRTLILLDGVRVPPTSPDGSVSIDTLPQAVVSRVDVVTGGASAVYGSDAVAGVVNFVLDKNFTGLKGDLQAGLSTYGDGLTYKAGATYGASLLEDRFHILLSAEYNVTEGIKAYNDRPLAKGRYCTAGAGTAASPFTVLENCASQSSTFGGYIANGVLAGNYFLPNGTLATFNRGGLGGVGGDGSNLSDEQDLTAGLKTLQTFGRVAYDVSDNLEAYAQIAVSQAINGPWQHGTSNTPAGTSQGVIIQSGNAFLNPSIQARLGPNDTFQLARFADPYQAFLMGKTDLPLPVSRQESNTRLIQTGLNGKFGDDWKWSVNYVNGVTKFKSRTYELQQLKLYAAVDAVRDPSGNIVCRVTLTHPNLYPGCVPLNLFGLGAPSQAAVDYTFDNSIWNVSSKLQSGSGYISGSPFSTWAGPVSIAAGGEYREQRVVQTSNSDPGVAIDTTGLRGLPASVVRFNTVNVGAFTGKVNVKEAYGEVLVPLLRDSAVAKSLDLSGAVRYTDYSTSGGETTWKLGFDYVSPIAGLRLRGTVSRDIRAPSLVELFAGVQQGQRAFADPHTGVSSVAILQTQGNASLEPEVGKTATVGFVYQPAFLPGFALSVDGYRIKIQDAIVTQDPVVAVTACEQSGGTGPTCAAVIRPLPFSDRTAANFPTTVLAIPLNVASLYQRGIDFEASYRFPVSDIFPGIDGRLELHAYASYVDKNTTDIGAGQPVQQTAGYFLNPKWKGSISEAYRSDRFDLFVQQRFSGSFHIKAFETAPTVYADHGFAPNQTFVDLTASFRPLEDRKLEAFVSVTNLFNRKPPVRAASPVGFVNLNYPTIRTQYDVIGRFFTVGLRVRR